MGAHASWVIYRIRALKKGTRRRQGELIQGAGNNERQGDEYGMMYGSRKHVKGGVFLKRKKTRYGGGNKVGERYGYELSGDEVTVTCWKDPSEEIERTTNGIVWFPELRRKS